MTQWTVAFSGLTFPPTSPFQEISSSKRLRSTTVLGKPSEIPETTSVGVDIGSSGCPSCGNCQCHSR